MGGWGARQEREGFMYISWRVYYVQAGQLYLVRGLFIGSWIYISSEGFIYPVWDLL